MRHLSTKAVGLTMIAAAALATGACHKAATTNVANTVTPINSMTPGNDASAMESIGAPTGNTMAPMGPPPATNASRTGNTARDLPSTMDEPHATTNRSSGVQSNISGM